MWTQVCTEGWTCEDTGSHLQDRERDLSKNSIDLVDTVVLDFEPVELQENEFLLCKLPGLRYFATIV